MKTFDMKLYKKCKKELNKKSEFLGYYYSPTLTALKQFIKNLKNKNILEIGYRKPLFLKYLENLKANTFGIDINPETISNNLIKMSIENPTKKFMKENRNKFHAIIERITLSRLYEEKHFLETGKHRFKNKEKILSNISELLKNNGILVLQDDRGSIFTEYQFKKFRFEKVMKETPIKFKDKKGKNLGWNVLVIYKKSK